MPGKNKPKRLDRNRAWRVARRKKKRNELVKGTSRNRKPRPKNKGVVVTRNSVPSKLGTGVPSSSVARNSVPSKLGTGVPSSSGKVVDKVKKVVKKKVVKKE